MVQDFAKQYPAAAGRLLLEQNRSADPHIERMIESFALLTGRIHHKLDDEFPELTDAMLNVMYPHYLAPVPSMAAVQFELDEARGQLPDGFEIPRGSRLQTAPLDGLACKYQTCFPVTLWPVLLRQARLHAPPFPTNLQVPPRTAAVLRLQFECVGGMNLAGLSLENLRFHLRGDPNLIPYLYEFIFNHTDLVGFRDASTEMARPAVLLRPEECIFQVGFERDEGMLPYPKRSFIGYRLLTEVFTFPSKFLFFDLGGWQQAAEAGIGDQIEVIFFLNRSMKNLEQNVDSSMFVQGCTPIVNLFEQTAEPIALTHTKHQYRITPDVAHPYGLEVYSVDSVTATDPNTGVNTEFQPFYSFRHNQSPEEQTAFWYMSRRPSVEEDDRGTEVWLSLVDLKFDPSVPANSTLVVRTTCTNRDLPVKLQLAGEALRFELEAAAPLTGIRTVRTPTAPLRPPPRRGGAWRLVSHTMLNHLSLSDPVEGLEALQEMFRLYDFSDPDAGQQQMAAINRQLIDGIVSMSTRRVVGRTGGDTASGFARGIEVTLEFDEQKYIGTGAFLFASVLERFLGLYASVNSFCQLVGKTSQGEGYFKKWPPRAGELQLV
ncbi:MAG: type VI secretion system baseplate subunit TssF [Gemmataceae bacterium]